jgi:hypothetical protein
MPSTSTHLLRAGEFGTRVGQKRTLLYLFVLSWLLVEKIQQTVKASWITRVEVGSEVAMNGGEKLSFVEVIRRSLGAKTQATSPNSRIRISGKLSIPPFCMFASL